MKIDQLHYFLQTAKFQHIGKAAKSLSISASAISHSIATLEEELGRQLFEKKGRQITLTQHGKMLAEKAEKILRQVEDLREEISSDEIEHQGHYRLAASHVLCSEYMAPALSELQTKFPKIRSELFTLRSADVVAKVASSELDMGLCFNPHDHPDIASERLWEGQLVLATKASHYLQKKSQWDPGKISSFPAVLPKPFQGIEVCEQHPVFMSHTIKPDVHCWVDSYEVATQIILQSDAWSFMPDILVKKTKSLKAIPVPPDWKAPYFIVSVWPKSRKPTSFLGSLLVGIKKSFAEV